MYSHRNLDYCINRDCGTITRSLKGIPDDSTKVWDKGQTTPNDKSETKGPTGVVKKDCPVFQHTVETTDCVFCIS